MDRGRVEGQEKLEGEVFQLRSPQKRNEIIPITAVLDGKTQEYVVKIGSFGETNKTLAEALHQLANQLEARHIFGSGQFDIEQMRGRKIRTCDYCGGKFFFARTVNEKWMPVDFLSVDAKEAKGMRLYTIIEVAGIPHVHPVPRGQSQVWIAHPDVCGSNSVEPNGAELSARWGENRHRAQKVELLARDSLVEILHDLEE